MDGYERSGLELRFIRWNAWYFDDEVCRKKLLEHFEVSSFAGLGLADYDCGIISAGALLQLSVGNAEKLAFKSDTFTPYAAGKFMMIDSIDKTKS